MMLKYYSTKDSSLLPDGYSINASQYLYKRKRRQKQYPTLSTNFINLNSSSSHVFVELKLVHWAFLSIFGRYGVRRKYFFLNNFPLLKEYIYVCLLHCLKQFSLNFEDFLCTHSFLYYVIFLQIKFIVDGHWTIDPQRESVTRGTINNNILVVGW